MFPLLTAALAAALCVLTAFSAWSTFAGRQVDNRTFWAAVAVEVLLVVQLVVGVLDRGNAPHGLSTGLWLAYLGALVVVPPAAVLWAVADRETRWGTGVLAIAAVSMLVMLGRLVQIWNGQG